MENTLLKLDPKAHFENELGLGDNELITLVGDALQGADGGELFLECIHNEALTFEEGCVKSTSDSTNQGFCLRRFTGECEGVVHGSELNPEAIKQAKQKLLAVGDRSGSQKLVAHQKTEPLYPLHDVLSVPLEERIALLQKIDAYIRSKDQRVREVTLSLTGQIQQVLIVREGLIVPDVRPLVRMNISVILAENNLSESGDFGYGGRKDYTLFFEEVSWQRAADKALREAHMALAAQPCPAGEMPVVLGPGWAAILLHEAIGHGLEGDFIFKGTSAFTKLLGEQIASPEVTVVDDGTIPGCRGSLTVDDEGVPTEKTVLIENGKLARFIQSQKTAKLLGVTPTGNGRRESHKHCPLVRMTNTYMLDGPYDPEEIIRSTPGGIYMENFRGGQVDITSGEFVFASSVAYLINENGELGTPVKGATLIGSGLEALNHIDMVGNNSTLDEGIGTCGKDGQGVPVGVGQPTLRLKGGVTVGGTK